MRKIISRLFALLLAFVIVIPNFVLAKEEDSSDSKEEAKKEPVIVYIFRGEGCPHCEEALTWFQSEEVQEKYGDYFELETYEVWNDEKNASLMDEVASYMGEEASGVPFMVIGEHSYGGFDSSDTQTLIDYIMEEYEKDPEDRTQIVPTVQKSIGYNDKAAEKNYDIIVWIVAIVIIVGIVVIIIKARKEN